MASSVCGNSLICSASFSYRRSIAFIAKELSGRTDLKVFYMPQNYEELLGQEQTPVEFLSVEAGREEADRSMHETQEVILLKLY